MALDNLDGFLDAIGGDQTLQDQIKAAADRATLISLVVRLGRDRGYRFTAEEVETLLEARQARSADELSEAQLEAVTGGFTDWKSTKSGKDLGGLLGK